MGHRENDSLPDDLARSLSVCYHGDRVMVQDIRQFIDLLRKEHEVVEIACEVDPHLEAAEIHRRVIAAGGPALLFRCIKGSPFPLVTNLFGSRKRIELAFGPRPERLVREISKLPEELIPPSPRKLWEKRALLKDLLKVGTKRLGRAPVGEVIERTPMLDKLPLLTTWEQDGGPFVTLPLVYTEHPETGVHNLGMYRIQRYDGATTGLHMQIGKGGGFHLAAAKALARKLPVNIHIGGAPALILAAIAPLPENVPELLLASLVLGGKLPLMRNPIGPLPVAGNAEFVLVGSCDPEETRPEGPFGDHYGYYSLQHDYPVFRCSGVLRRRNPICTATVVGKPRQEDFFIGDYLQELLRPVIKIVMPSVLDIWAYGETGYHSLAAAVVRQRYKREAMMSAFRILGEGQLSLTKFLLVSDRILDLRDFKRVLSHVLERADFRSDLYLFGNLSMDTLDYNGPKVNEGSKGVLLGVGDPIRVLPERYTGPVPPGVRSIHTFCPGCIVIDGPRKGNSPGFADSLREVQSFSDWPLIVLVDDAPRAVKSEMAFLWQTFTRFEPAADIYAKREVVRNHLSYTPPIIIDARLKPDFPEELNADPAAAELVTKRWGEYFPSGGIEMGKSDLTV